MATFKYAPEWQGPLSGRSFEKQTEDAINAILQRLDEVAAAQSQVATQTSNGLMSAADKASLDAIPFELAEKADNDAVVHLAGAETISGSKTLSANLIRNGALAMSNTETGSVSIHNGTDASGGGGIWLYGKMHSNAGVVRLQAYNGVYRQLNCKPDGTLTWNGQPVQTSSDERLKTPISSVPEEVLDAWEAVGWGQFKYRDAVAAKGESARLHLGLIAQRVKAVFEARGQDACQYGVLCHETREATEEDPAVDLWMVRYEEALAMEACCQRRRADKLQAQLDELKARIEALET